MYTFSADARIKGQGTRRAIIVSTRTANMPELAGAVAVKLGVAERDVVVFNARPATEVEIAAEIDRQREDRLPPTGDIVVDLSGIRSMRVALMLAQLKGRVESQVICEMVVTRNGVDTYWKTWAGQEVTDPAARQITEAIDRAVITFACDPADLTEAALILRRAALAVPGSRLGSDCGWLMPVLKDGSIALGSDIADVVKPENRATHGPALLGWEEAEVEPWADANREVRVPQSTDDIESELYDLMTGVIEAEDGYGWVPRIDNVEVLEAVEGWPTTVHPERGVVLTLANGQRFMLAVVAPIAPADVPQLDESKYRTEMRPIGRVKRYHNNPRSHEKGVQKLAAIISAVGWRQPILVDKDGVIILGDGRYCAAEMLGLPAVPVWVADDLTPEQIKSYRIADNRVHEESAWDYGKLGVELNELMGAQADMTLTGFDEAELKQLLASDDDSVLEPVSIRPAPEFAWVLIGIPLARYVEISEEVEKISKLPDIFCEVAANNQPPKKLAPEA